MVRHVFGNLDESTSRELHGFPYEAVAHSLKPNVSYFLSTLAAADLQCLRRGFGFVTHLVMVTSSSTNRLTSEDALGKPPPAMSIRATWTCCSTMVEQGKDVDGRAWSTGIY